jgi:hypothetical protein
VAGGTARIVDAGVSGTAWSQGASASAATPGVQTWSIPICTVTDKTTGAVSLSGSVINLIFNKQLDGAAIQTTPSDCTPAGGWLTVTPSAPAGSTWYSCYSPSAPAANLGGSVIVYLAPTAPVSTGWADAATLAMTDLPINLAGKVAGESIDVTVTLGTACPP